MGGLDAQVTRGTAELAFAGAFALADLTLGLTGRVAIPGDTTLDGVVNQTDLDVLIGNFGLGDVIFVGAGFDRSGVVDSVDVELLLAAWAGLRRRAFHRRG